MKALLWALLLAVIAAAVALLARDAGGNVVFFVPPYRIDLSVHLFAVLAAVALVATFWIGRLVQKLADFPARVAAYRQRRSELGSTRALREALRALFEGRFARAERAAQAAQQSPEIAALAALVGARAAHRMQEQERRDQWLARAADEEGLQTARLLTAAELWTDSHETQRALEALGQLQAGGARHIQVARVALAAQLQAGRWHEVLRLTRLLAKRRALHEAAVRRLKRLAYRELLAEARHDAGLLQRAFEQIPAEDRRLPEVALEAARLLNAAGRGNAAADALEEALDAHWDERLLDEYSQASVAPVRPRIERATQWLSRYPQDAALLRCLGLLCLRDQLWGKARSYLQESQRLRPHPVTALALAQLAEATGQGEEAQQHYRTAALGLAQLLQSCEQLAQGRAVRGAAREVAASEPLA